jgi:hypothetical protein
MKTKIEVTAIVAVVLFFSSVSAASTYYVAKGGRDTNTGSSTSPFLTIPYAISKAVYGDTIIVGAGVYSEYKSTYGIRFDKSGVTLRSEPRGAAILDLLNKPDSNHVIYLEGSDNTIDGFQIRNGAIGGITIWRNNNKIINNEIYNNGNNGGETGYGQNGVISAEYTSGNYYSGNFVHHNGRIAINSNSDHGFYLCGDNEVVVNNVIIRNSAYGIQIAGYQTVSNLKVYNNTIAHNGRSGIVIFKAILNVLIKNNIFYKNAHYAITSSGAHGSGVVFDRNLFFGNQAGDKIVTDADPARTISWLWSDYTFTMGTNYVADPVFAGAEDFHLTRNSLNAIDMGTNVGLPFSGSAPDIGAYEFVSATQNKPLSPTNLQVK